MRTEPTRATAAGAAVSVPLANISQRTATQLMNENASIATAARTTVTRTALGPASPARHAPNPMLIWKLLNCVPLPEIQHVDVRRITTAAVTWGAARSAIPVQSVLQPALRKPALPLRTQSAMNLKEVTHVKSWVL